MHDKELSFIRLNKFISNTGVCARREADKLIAKGYIAVNGFVMKTIGSKIPIDAVVTYQGRRLHAERLTYLLLNKPKGYVTTLKDPQGRKTVLGLIGKQLCSQRVYPVGRLDYHTTGLLLLTNDGRLAHRLAHPASRVPKCYHVVLDQPLHWDHLHNLLKGIFLEDGFAWVDQLTLLGEDQLHLVIHMGRNRIVRRIFQYFGYRVVALDRIGYGPLTKANMPYGKWRFLTEKELSMLKVLTS